MILSPTHRDIADFFSIALANSWSDGRVIRESAVIAWVDSVIAVSPVCADWMTELSLAKTADAVADALRHVPPPGTERLGVSMFVAFVHRSWREGRISRSVACGLLWSVRDLVLPEHERAAVIPDVTLEDADACVAQGMSAAEQYQRVDDALTDMFQQYQQYELLIPATVHLKYEHPAI